MLLIAARIGAVRTTVSIVDGSELAAAIQVPAVGRIVVGGPVLLLESDVAPGAIIFYNRKIHISKYAEGGEANMNPSKISYIKHLHLLISSPRSRTILSIQHMFTQGCRCPLCSEVCAGTGAWGPGPGPGNSTRAVQADVSLTAVQWPYIQCIVIMQRAANTASSWRTLRTPADTPCLHTSLGQNCCCTRTAASCTLANDCIQVSNPVVLL